MAGRTDATAPLDQFTTFGALLKYLRRRAQLTQRQLATAVSYSFSHISRLENDMRVPDLTALRAHLVPALRLDPRTHAPVIERLTELAALARDTAGSESGHARRVVRPAGGLVPRQLPSTVRRFVGRPAHRAELDRLLDESRPQGAPVVIAVLHGTPGVGKTALATHWAHRAAAGFGDGQLFVNLRGFDPSGSPVDPLVAVRGFLDALGVAPERVPSNAEALVALYRSVLAGKRLLLLLDNAASVEQVRPLLPGTPGCLVLVTSRRRLPSLTAVEGAHPISLELLSPPEAHELLVQHLGPARVEAEPDAINEIIDRCARLPLALALVAARAAGHPRFPLATFAEELRTSRPALDALRDDEQTTDVRAVFSWSYRNLPDAEARLFRLLSLAPGPDITAPAVASLAGVPVELARNLLASLVRCHLVAEPTPGRYELHDLLRAYAAEQAELVDPAPAPARTEAELRLLDHYVHTAQAAGALLYPSRDPIGLGPLRPTVTPEPITDLDRAVSWFTAEHRVLLAAVSSAADGGFDHQAWQLAWTVAAYLERRGHWHDWATIGEVAMRAANRLGEPEIQARFHRLLGFAYTRLGRYDEAEIQLRQALARYRAAGDTIGRGHTEQLFVMMCERTGRHAEALRHGQLALKLYQAAGHRHGQAQAMNNIGWEYGLLGQFTRTLTYCRRALPLLQDLGNRDGEANTWDSLGYAHHHLGQYGHAADCYQRAIDLYRDIGDRYYEADTLVHLGENHCAAGDSQAAGRVWLAALVILDDIGHPDAARVRAKLEQLAPDHPAVA